MTAIYNLTFAQVRLNLLEKGKEKIGQEDFFRKKKKNNIKIFRWFAQCIWIIIEYYET